MRRQLLPALRMLLVLTVITGLAYPLAMTGLAQVLFADKADGSVLRDADGTVVGSKLLGQTFTAPEYFHPRPSSAGAGASGSTVAETDADGNEVLDANGEANQVPADVGDAASGANNSSASNLGPTNDAFLVGHDDPETADVDEADDTGVDARIRDYRDENGLDPGVEVPVDAVTGSGSGLDPHISIANARLQALRVAQARGIDDGQVRDLIDQHTDGRSLGFLGEPGVNVLTLNLALDDLT